MRKLLATIDCECVLHALNTQIAAVIVALFRTYRTWSHQRIDLNTHKKCYKAGKKPTKPISIVIFLRYLVLKMPTTAQ